MRHQWEHPSRNMQEAVVSKSHVESIPTTPQGSLIISHPRYRMNDCGWWKSNPHREMVT